MKYLPQRDVQPQRHAVGSQAGSWHGLLVRQKYTFCKNAAHVFHLLLLALYRNNNGNNSFSLARNVLQYQKLDSYNFT